MFDNLTDTGFTQQKDVLVGNAKRFFDTDIYTFKIKMAYGIISSGGAKGVTFILTEEFEGKEHRETVYVTNKKGENHTIKDGRKVAMMGFELVNDICMMTSGRPLSAQTIEKKQVMVWDNDVKKEVPQEKPVLMDLIGQNVDLAIVHRIKNKQAKQGDVWVNTDEKIEENRIEKAFHSQSNQTMVEALNQQEASFYGKWIEKNRGVTRDQFKPVDGSSSAKSSPSFGSAPTASESTAAAKPLFGAKA